MSKRLIVLLAALLATASLAFASAHIEDLLGPREVGLILKDPLPPCEPSVHPAPEAKRLLDVPPSRPGYLPEKRGVAGLEQEPCIEFVR